MVVFFSPPPPAFHLYDVSSRKVGQLNVSTLSGIEEAECLHF